MYKCNRCHNTFEKASYIIETHGFGCGPFEKRSVCPICNRDDFNEYIEKEQYIDKIEVAKTIIIVIARLNRLHSVISDKNGDIEKSIGDLVDLVIDMADPDSFELTNFLLAAESNIDAEKCIDLFEEELAI